MKLKKQTSLSSLGEFGLIDFLSKSAPISKDVIKGIGDDTAVLPFNRSKHLLLTTDMLSEGVHFTLKNDRKLIGRKALAVNISDIAAMGGSPKFAVISLGATKKTPTRFIQDVYQGINAIAKEFGVSIVGGDTVATKKMMICISLLGEVKKKDLTLRSGAKVGDKIFVTGPLGRSLKTKKHLSFIPRVKESQYLMKHLKPNAMIDVSDGLLADLNHILKQSKVGALLDKERIPVSKNATLSNAFCDGEDFELIFTLSKRKADIFLKKKQNAFKFYCIGEIVEKNKGLKLRDKKGKIQKLTPKGYKHF